MAGEAVNLPCEEPARRRHPGSECFITGSTPLVNHLEDCHAAFAIDPYARLRGFGVKVLRRQSAEIDQSQSQAVAQDGTKRLYEIQREVRSIGVD